MRNKSLDSNRRRLKEELEAKERAAREETTKRESTFSTQTDEERLREEVERLRREGSKILEQENDYIRRQIEKEIEELKAEKLKKSTNDSLPRLKCKWDRKLELTEKQLRTKFQSCGQISGLVVKNNTAIVEFEHTQSAVDAYNLRSPSFEIKWLQGKPSEVTSNLKAKCPNFSQFSSGLGEVTKPKSGCFYDVDYERDVIAKLRNAQRLKNK